MFDSKIAAAFIDNVSVESQRHRILGVRLRPFSLWHHFLLQACESPFIKKGNVTLRDLKTAIGICRLRFGQSKVIRPFWPPIAPRKKLERDVAKFLSYVGDYLNRPDYVISETRSAEEKPKKRNNPPPESVQAAFEAAWGANCKVAEAWDMPIGQAYMAQAMYYRHAGAPVDFMDDGERKFQAEMKAAGIPTAE